MTKMNHLTRTVTTAVCIALCVVLPMALHWIPGVGSINLGTLLSPMHLPVLLCGLVCGWPYGLACGILGPLLSSLLTSMPGWGYLPTMMVELALYGLISGILIQLVHTGRLMVDLYISLIVAMLAGRIITGIARALIFVPRSGGIYSLNAWATGYFVSSFPGIILQLILLPILYLALQRAKLIPNRYQKQKAA
ncbi:MAG: ECF transporter S component [Acetatifactor sp.]|nr:ECF transporter S component [Acetatifactor sp.]